MADIFLSYAREDFDSAQAIASALKRAGHSVWWDSHIRGGAQYAPEIEAALAAVIARWSRDRGGPQITSQLLIYPATDAAMRAVFDVVGVTNILAKCHGPTNPYNVVRATLNGLLQQRRPSEIAAKRGKKVEEIAG